jgi:hypothetical protein
MTKIPESAQEFFDVQLPAALEAHPLEAKTIGGIYAFKISGEEGANWTIDLKSPVPVCVRDSSMVATCTIEVSAEDFKSMIASPALGMQLYFQGKLRIVGDPMLATKLHQLFALAV